MSNYFVVNRPSNLVVGVIATSYTPVDTPLKMFVLANEQSLAFYDKHLGRDHETLLDIGELMKKSAHIADQVSKGKTGNAKATSQRTRAEQSVSVQDREEYILTWIRNHPDANEYDLHDAIPMGIVAARAYIRLYGFQ
ncbi:hypothetical protein [Pseudomonas syringae]|uniref:Uncharacterized protein n=1 Tax=Pseudomonas syringae Cit 7 TaxID=629264 RepID=A0A8T8M2L8_PSESX|nr:hypothetical protein [Pseudomonas syringae]ALE01043.1 hypothetical protein PSYRMG_25270 [Pseudomonas syringae UMAF0158]MCK9731910.1 hypothetical protein [Pseudomonas syringae pv. syringae]PBP60207.1 hypothetical protein CCL19_22695 [Pseudomonas syringae]QUP67961.1 hypothetical protein PSYCIT7_010155 [Pseudomonas syringae Cit 7]SDS28582.1 hypothetical protein SAMN05421724_1083 [Pseudomonas syringae]